MLAGCPIAPVCFFYSYEFLVGSDDGDDGSRVPLPFRSVCPAETKYYLYVRSVLGPNGSLMAPKEKAVSEGEQDEW